MTTWLDRWKRGTRARLDPKLIAARYLRGLIPLLGFFLLLHFFL